MPRRSFKDALVPLAQLVDHALITSTYLLMWRDTLVHIEMMHDMLHDEGIDAASKYYDHLKSTHPDLPPFDYVRNSLWTHNVPGVLTKKGNEVVWAIDKHYGSYMDFGEANVSDTSEMDDEAWESFNATFIDHMKEQYIGVGDGVFYQPRPELGLLSLFRKPAAGSSSTANPSSVDENGTSPASGTGSDANPTPTSEAVQLVALFRDMHLATIKGLVDVNNHLARTAQNANDNLARTAQNANDNLARVAAALRSSSKNS